MPTALSVLIEGRQEGATEHCTAGRAAQKLCLRQHRRSRNPLITPGDGRRAGTQSLLPMARPARAKP